MSSSAPRRVLGITAVAAVVVSLLVGVVAGSTASATPTGTFTTLVDDASAAGLAVTRAGVVYYATTSGQIIRRNPDGARTVIAGAGTVGSYAVKTTPKPATSIKFATLSAMQLDPSEQNLYVLDYGWSAVLRINLTTGTIVRVAGDPYSMASTSPDGGLAVDTVLVQPTSLAADSAGNVYIGQSISAQAIRKVDARTGIISCVAECTTTPTIFGDGGPAANAAVSAANMFVDGNRLLFAQAIGHAFVVRSIDLSTTVVSHLAGRYTPLGNPIPCDDYGVDGPALQACLSPRSVRTLTTGELLIGGGRVRVVDHAGISRTVGCLNAIPENVPPVGQTVATTTVRCQSTRTDADAAGNVYLLTGDGKISVIDPDATAPNTTTTPTPTTTPPPPTGGGGVGYAAVDPARIVDSRTGAGGYATPWPAATSRSVKVTGVAGVPTDAAGVVLNVTATNASAATHLSVYPTAGTRPNASNVNVAAGATDANLVIVGVGAGGTVEVFNNAGTVDVVIDVAGYYRVGGGDRYTPLAPRRDLDTRPPDAAGALRAGETRTLDLASDRDIPPDATSVVLNLTATNPTNATHLTVHPTDQTRPNASNVNVAAGVTDANLVIARFAPGTRKVSIFNNTGTVDVIADVTGYYRPGTGAGYTPAVPMRVLDSRTGVGGYPTPWASATSRTLQVAGVATVPTTATAVVLNLTATNPTAATHLSVYPTGQTPPTVSNLNLPAGRTDANLVVVPVGIDGQITIFNNTGTVDVIADLAGWYAP
ncbi:MAG: hypothetical protein R2726_06770 [Acidimicrobiales bacterium]